MKKPAPVIFVESNQGVESFFTRGLRSGATAAGWKPEIVFLADAAGHARSEARVREDIIQRQPATICFLMDGPLDLKNLWDDPRLQSVEKISLWFDDYYRSPKTLAAPETWTRWQQEHGVRVGIWDGHWRRKWKELTHTEAFPIHLAADPDLLRDDAEPWEKAWGHRAVFVGTIPSQHSLETASATLPSPLQRLLQHIRAAMQNGPWPVRPYDLAQSCRAGLSTKLQAAIDASLEKPVSLAFWNHLLWRWGKRIARLRGLAAVAEAGPLAILSGHGTESYAHEDDLRSALPKGSDWIYADTRSVPSAAWSRLFRSGKWQVQITDPQSVEGGLPFRVFECAACGVPLLSDHRNELAELFPENTGLMMAQDEKGLRETSVRLFEMPKKELEERGRLFHHSFIKEHTWECRWRQIVKYAACGGLV